MALESTDPTRFMWSRFRKYGNFFRTQLLTTPVYVINDPVALRPLLRDEGAIFDTPFSSFKMLAGQENVMQHKDLHPIWRRNFMLAVGPAALERMVPRINAIMDGYVAKWAVQGCVAMYDEARRMGVDLAVHVIMALELKKVDPDWLKQQLGVYLNGLYGIPIAIPGSQLDKALKAKEQLLDALEPEMEEEYNKACERLTGAATPQDAWARLNAATGGGSGVGEDKSRVTITETMVTNYWLLGKRERRDAARTVLLNTIAGGDTTRFALFNTWTLLAKSPRVQQAMYEEQQKVIAARGPELTYEAVHGHMPYLDATLKEAMRLLPASQGGMRRLTEDLRIGGHALPKGAMIWYHAGLLHCTDPLLWDGQLGEEVPAHMDWAHRLDEAFRPERWLSDDTRPRHYYTFGTGSHVCAGMQLVYLEVKMLLVRMVRQFKMELKVPSMMDTAKHFPFVQPKPGTDIVLLTPRQEPAALAA